MPDLVTAAVVSNQSSVVSFQSSGDALRDTIAWDMG